MNETPSLEDLRALSDVATPGPWTVGRLDWRRRMTDWWGIFPPPRISHFPGLLFPSKPVAYLDLQDFDRADAEFAAAAVNYVRAALAVPAEMSGRSAAPIDVERLARALLNAQNEPGEPIDHSEACLQTTCPVAAELVAFAPRLATE